MIVTDKRTSTSDNPTATLVFSVGSAIQSRPIDAAEFLWGDAYAGWIRDFLSIADWAVDAGFECYTFTLPAGRIVHAAYGDDGFLIGSEHAERECWFATHDENLACRVFREVILCPAPQIAGAILAAQNN